MYKFLDADDQVTLPTPQANAGLYAPDAPHVKTTWSKDYRKYIPPDAVAYSSTYFELARGHINTANRPGNNTILNNPFRFYSDASNALCLV